MATGLSHSADPMDAWLEATRGYLELDDAKRAEEQYVGALAHVRAAETKLKELDELLHPRRGWYVGTSLGATFGHVSSAEFENTLFEEGHVTDVELDTNRYGFEVFLGYHFTAPFAVRAGYVSLEGPSSTIDELGPSGGTADLLNDIADHYPVGGKGWSLALEWTALRARRFELYARVGAWSWEAQADVRLVSGASSVEFEDTGVDPFLGGGCAWRLTTRLRCTAELERFLIDGDPIDLLALGITYQP
jgi:hypothetical protein